MKTITEKLKSLQALKVNNLIDSKIIIRDIFQQIEAEFEDYPPHDHYSHFPFGLRDCLLNSPAGDLMIDQIEEKLETIADEGWFPAFIIDGLIQASAKINCQRLLLDILKGNRPTHKIYIVHHNCLYPIAKIFQTKECKDLIVSFVNTSDFFTDYERRCNLTTYHAFAHAFPSQYFNCFHIRGFDEEVIGALSKSQLSKAASKERLESIRRLQKPQLQKHCIDDLVSSLNPMNRPRFLRLVDKTFPHLEVSERLA
jgi:hypothetical protein